MFPGDYVRAATDSGGGRPLLTVERTDKMRVVFQMPDRDVPYCNVGDRAVVEIDALPGPPLEAKVSRMASSEDPTSRLMHVEIDLPNPTGKIAQGMYGHVTIFLDQGADLLSVPSSALTGKGEQGNGIRLRCAGRQGSSDASSHRNGQRSAGRHSQGFEDRGRGRSASRPTISWIGARSLPCLNRQRRRNTIRGTDASDEPGRITNFRGRI